MQKVELLSGSLFFIITVNSTQHFFCPFTLSCSVLSSSSQPSCGTKTVLIVHGKLLLSNTNRIVNINNDLYVNYL